MNSAQTRRVLGVGMAMAAIVGLSAGPAYARTTVEKLEVPAEQLFYDNVVTGDGEPPYILLAGGDFGDFCEFNEPIVNKFVRVKGTPPDDGAVVEERFRARVEMALYDLEGLDAFVWLDTYCPTYFTTGETPEQLAHGAGTMRSVVHVEFNGPGVPEDISTVNGAHGVLKTPEGETLVVRGEAELTLEPDFSVDHVSLEVLNR